jgi:hypothetical protein
VFSNPGFEEIYKDEEKQGFQRTLGPVHAPLSGQEFLVSEALLERYAAAAESFFRKIADYCKAQSDDFLPSEGVRRNP